MDSTKNFFDAWVNTQTQLVDNLMDTSKKLQASFDGGDKNLQKSAEVYQDWLERQQTILNNLLGSLKTQFNQEQAPDFFKDWLQAQINFGKHWLDMYGNNVNANQSNNPQFTQMQENWNKLYKEWSNQFGKPLNGASYMPGGMPQDSLRNLLDNTRIYLQMFELWQPILNMMQAPNMHNMMNGSFNTGMPGMPSMPQFDMKNIEAVYKMFDLEKYKTLLDTVLPNMTTFNPEAIRQQMKQYEDMFGGGMEGMKDMLTKAFQMPSSMLPTEMGQQFDMISGMNEQMIERMAELSLPFVTMMPAGREKEMYILQQAAYEKYVRYYVKGVEMQTIVYNAGFKSIEKAIRDIAAKVSENAQMMSFDDFYNHWLNSIEEDFIELFASETFSVLQGDLLKLQMDMKADNDKLMELVLAPLPVVPRSELDEVNATVHELRRKVRSLEKQIKSGTKTESKTETKPANNTPKKTTTRKKSTSTTTKAKQAAKKEAANSEK